MVVFRHINSMIGGIKLVEFKRQNKNKIIGMGFLWRQIFWLIFQKRLQDCADDIFTGAVDRLLLQFTDQELPEMGS